MIVKVNYSEQVLQILKLDPIVSALDKFNYRNKHGLDLINLAAEKGNINILISLVECQLDFKTLDEKGNSPLANALIKKHADVVKYLIEKGVDVFNDEYLLNLLVAEDEPDYVDLALSIYAENNVLKNDLNHLENLYLKLKDAFAYSKAHLCVKVLEDFYKNFKLLKYISKSTNHDKSNLDISDINDQTGELSMTKKLEQYIKTANQKGDYKSNIDYNEYTGQMRRMSMHDKGYNNLKSNLNCKLLKIEKIIDLNEI